MKIFIAKYPGKYPGMGGGMIIVAANSLNEAVDYARPYSKDYTIEYFHEASNILYSGEAGVIAEDHYDEI